MTRLENALATLNAMIAAGSEFPDAVIIAAHKHGVSVVRLTAAYDEQFA